MKKILKYLNDNNANVTRQTDDEVSGTMYNKHFHVSGYTATRGKSDKIIGYLVRFGNSKSDTTTTQQSVINFFDYNKSK